MYSKVSLLIHCKERVNRTFKHMNWITERSVAYLEEDLEKNLAYLRPEEGMRSHGKWSHEPPYGY